MNESVHNPPRAPAVCGEADPWRERLAKNPAAAVRVTVCDVDGVLRGKYFAKERFEAVLAGGFGFCNGVFGWDIADELYDNVAYTNWRTGYPDAQARIDTATYREVPWADAEPWFLADFCDTAGEPLPVCPRSVLRRVLARAAALGFHVLVGVEYEWYNFAETSRSLADKRFRDPEPLTPGMYGYSVQRLNQHREYSQALLRWLPKVGVPLEALHTENGPGLYEAAIVYVDALQAADRAAVFKAVVKDIAARFDILPCFMAKWRPTLQGCSGHIHQSLERDGRNVFFAADAPLNLSETARSYIAGQLRYLPEVLALYAPTVNSYKRLVDGHWAPVRPTWGIDNRVAALRVLNASAQSCRIETRSPGADSNPYLAVAACIASGLRGIEENLQLVQSPQGSPREPAEPPRLARTLSEATAAFAASSFAREWLGDAFVEHFAATREWEWRKFLDAVTDWELDRYFEAV